MSKPSKRTLIGAMLVAVAFFAFPVLTIALSIASDCNSAARLACEWADYLHSQSTAYTCDGEVRWGRWP